MVVSGYSDDNKSVQGPGEFSAGMANVGKTKLQPCHEPGKHKWLAMREEYSLHGVHPPDAGSRQRVKHILQGYGHYVMC
ncbi:pyruvate formate-lyase 1-activating enzyme [Erwinia amylovora]|uniref:pyruvate formate-lyase 1-activating enzyme n=1 Tax=Erwinia amylovora TaxID=552 RepID=UPI003D172DCA